MKKQIYDEKNGLSYTLHGDYYLPDLEINEEEPTYGPRYTITYFFRHLLFLLFRLKLRLYPDIILHQSFYHIFPQHA